MQINQVLKLHTLHYHEVAKSSKSRGDGCSEDFCSYLQLWIMITFGSARARANRILSKLRNKCIVVTSGHSLEKIHLLERLFLGVFFCLFFCVFTHRYNKINYNKSDYLENKTKAN